MDKRDSIISLLNEQGLMPLYYYASEDVSLELMDTLYKSGIRLLEYTNRGEKALQNFKAMKQFAEKNCDGLFLGAGTIKDEQSAGQFIDAGADFLVSPALAEDVYDVTYSNKILWIPGCMTPTEILKAEQLGVKLVKVFPGNILGPSFVQAVKEIFPSMQFMPTGGVEASAENLKAWFDAGACAVGMGSKLINADLLIQKDYEAIAIDVKLTLERIKNIKAGSVKS